jgi:hypothetical protein
MKHKLKLSFWALGILVLVLSQLFVLAPAQKAFADTLTPNSVQQQTYKYSVYAIVHTCLASAKGRVVLYANEFFSSIDGNLNYHVLGFAGSDEGNNDGQVYCDQAVDLWQSIAGYSSREDLLKDLHITSKNSAGKPVWSLDGTVADSQKALDSAAQKRGISTSLPKWGEYVLAATAMTAKCGLTDSSSGTVPYVSDDNGTITYKSYNTKETNSFATLPDKNGTGTFKFCSALADMMKDSSKGAVAFANAITQDRIDATINLAVNSICNDQLKITNDEASQSCFKNFRNYLDACIDQYYAGNASSGGSSGSRTEPFDVNVVAKCVAGKAKTGGYKISADDIASILTDAQNQTTPDTGDSSDTPTDPCSILDNSIPMRWLACALLTAGSGMAAAAIYARLKCV